MICPPNARPLRELERVSGNSKQGFLERTREEGGNSVAVRRIPILVRTRLIQGMGEVVSPNVQPVLERIVLSTGELCPKPVIPAIDNPQRSVKIMFARNCRGSSVTKGRVQKYSTSGALPLWLG